MILLPLPPKCWNLRCALPRPTSECTLLPGEPALQHPLFLPSVSFLPVTPTAHVSESPTTLTRGSPLHVHSRMSFLPSLPGKLFMLQHPVQVSPLPWSPLLYNVPLLPIACAGISITENICVKMMNLHICFQNQTNSCFFQFWKKTKQNKTWSN